MTEMAGDDASRDPGLGAAVLRSFLGALVIVLVPALVFWALGAGDRDETTVVADQPSDDPDEADSDDDATEPGDEDPPGEPAQPDDGDPGEPEPDPDPGNGEGDGPGDGDGEPMDPEPEPETPAFPPADISVQVLDGHAGGDGSGARAVAEQLRDAGYRIIAENRAIPYEVTAVLWTAGFEAQAQQVAAEISAPEVREQPGTLSDQVMVHVVVGADRG